MKFEVPICEVDSGDEFEQLLFDFFGDTYSPPAKAKAMARSVATHCSLSKPSSKSTSGEPATDAPDVVENLKTESPRATSILKSEETGSMIRLGDYPFHDLCAIPENEKSDKHNSDTDQEDSDPYAEGPCKKFQAVAKSTGLCRYPPQSFPKSPLNDKAKLDEKISGSTDVSRFRKYILNRAQRRSISRQDLYFDLDLDDSLFRSFSGNDSAGSVISSTVTGSDGVVKANLLQLEGNQKTGDTSCLHGSSTGTSLETLLGTSTQDSLDLNQSEEISQATSDDDPSSLAKMQQELARSNMGLIMKLAEEMSGQKTKALLRAKIAEASQQVKFDKLNLDLIKLQEENTLLQQERTRLHARLNNAVQESRLWEARLDRCRSILIRVYWHARAFEDASTDLKEIAMNKHFAVPGMKKKDLNTGDPFNPSLETKGPDFLNFRSSPNFSSGFGFAAFSTKLPPHPNSSRT